MNDDFSELDADISQGCDDAEQYVRDILSGPDEILRCFAYSKYIMHACFKIMKESGMPAREIDKLSRNIDEITKQQIDNDFKSK